MKHAATYEAVQSRPVYFDGKGPYPVGGPGDWRMAHHRVAREFPTLALAEGYARRILGQRPGVPVELWRRVDGRSEARVAVVSRDALERTWTDAMTWEALI